MYKRLLSVLTAGLLLFGNAVPAFSAENEPSENSGVEAAAEQSDTGQFTAEIPEEESLDDEGTDANLSEAKESVIETPGSEDPDAELSIIEESISEESISEEAKKGVSTVEEPESDGSAAPKPEDDTALLASDLASGTTGNLTWKISASGILTVSGNGAIPDYASQSSSPWFRLRESITGIVISKGVTSIGNFAFYNLHMAESLSISGTVTSIGTSSFAFCAMLKSVTVPGNVKTVGFGAFQNCNYLNTVTLNEGVTSVGGAAFYSDKALKTITIPVSCTTLTDGVFGNCSALTDIYYNGTSKQWSNITFTPALNFYDTVTVHYNNVSISKATITLSKTSYAYTGKARKPSVTVKYKSKTLTKGTDYKISYSNNTKAGTAKVKITGLGSYGGSTTKTFKITAVKLSSAALNKNYTSVVYTGKAQKPSKKFTVKAKVNGTTTKLTYGTDYKITYKNNKNVGTATATITGIGNFKGTIKKTFKIVPKAAAILAPTGTNSTLTIKWKKQATQTSGYEIQYAKNKKFTSGKKSVTLGSTTTTSKKISGLSAPTKYFVRVRTYKTVSGTKYYSAWSAVKNTTVLAKGMKTYNGHIYQLFNTSTTWDEADSKCKSAGGHLLTITSEAEQSFVNNSLLSTGTRNCYWLDGETIKNEKLKWLTGEKASYINLAPPTKLDNGIGAKLMLYRKKNPLGGGSDSDWLGKWNDIASDGTSPGQNDFFGRAHFGYICEWE